MGALGNAYWVLGDVDSPRGSIYFVAFFDLDTILTVCYRIRQLDVGMKSQKKMLRAIFLALTIGILSFGALAQDSKADLDFWIKDDLAWGLSYPVAMAQLGAIRCNDPATATSLEVYLVHLAESAGFSGSTELQNLHDEQDRCCKVLLSGKWDTSEPCNEAEFAALKASAKARLDRTADRIKRRNEIP